MKCQVSDADALKLVGMYFATAGQFLEKNNCPKKQNQTGRKF